MVISKMLELSTMHLTYKTCTLMDGGKFRIAEYPCGYFVYADPWQIKHEDVSDYPKDLLACIKLALEYDCTYIIFDSDVEPIEDLPIYDW